MKLHLPKSLFVAVLSAMAALNAAEGDSISISFGSTNMDNASAESSLGGVGPSGWNIVAAANTTGTSVKNQNGAAAGTLVMSNVFGSWNSSNTDVSTVLGVVQRNYIDIKNHSGGNVHTISLYHDYWLADVTYYLSGDNGGTYAPMEVNGKTYIGGTDVEGNAAWGTRGGVTEYNDTNSITVTGLAGGVVVGKNVYTSATARATLGGMQISDKSSTNGIFGVLGSGETSVDSVQWTRGGESVDLSTVLAGKKFLGVTADAAGSTLKLNGGDTVDSLAAVQNVLTIKSDSAVNITDLYTYTNAGIKLETEANVGTIRGTASLEIGENGILNTSGAEVGSHIYTMTGTGVINATGNVSIVGATGVSNVATCEFAGTLNVAAGSKLLIGKGVEGEGRSQQWSVDMSDATIVTNGGLIHYNGHNSTIGTLKINASGDLHAFDSHSNEEVGLKINNLDLQTSSLRLYNDWKMRVDIGVLTGEDGALSIENYNDSDDARKLIVNIGEIEAGARIASNSAELNIGTTADSAVAINGTISNTGVLNVTGNISISDDLLYYTMKEPGTLGGLSVNGTDGYQITNGSTYYLVDNDGGQVTFNELTATYLGDTITLNQDADSGDVTFVGGSSIDSIYHVNTVDVTVGGSAATEGIERTSGFAVAADRTVTIAGASGISSAKDLLLNTTGDGSVKLTTDIELLANENTQAKGTLTVSNVTLTFSGGNNNAGSISSFSAVTLDNAHVYFNNQTGTFQNVTVTENGASLELYDMGAPEDSYALSFAGTTTLNGDYTVTSTWNSQLNIAKLTGSGDLNINDNERSQLLQVSIGAAENYTGSVNVRQTYANLALDVAENAGVNVDYRGINGDELNIQGIKAGNTVTLAGVIAYFTKDSVIAADVRLENTNTSAGIEINDGYSNSTNTFAGKMLGTGNMVINKGDLVGFTQKFTGDISGWASADNATGARLDIANGTGNKILFTQDATEINIRQIEARNNAQAEVTFDHDKAVTVNSEFLQSSGGKLNVVVKNSSSQGTTFTNSYVSMASLTVNENTKVSFTGVDALALSSLTLKEMTTMVVDNVTVGTAVATRSSDSSVSQATIHGGATVDGNLDLSYVNSLTLNGVESDNSITVTGNLALSLTGSIELGGEILGALSGLSGDDKLNIFTVGSLSLGGNAVLTDISVEDGYTLNQVFSNSDFDDYYLGYTAPVEGSTQGGVLYVGLAVPEPTTVTLSLVALAALAARRRRR